jgi:GTP cyclohydrolase I
MTQIGAPASTTPPAAMRRPCNAQQAARDGVRALLHLAGDDPDRPGLARTPDRVVAALLEMTTPPDRTVAELLAVQFEDAGEVDQMVCCGPVEFVSLCEHHLLPFYGHAWVAYLPLSRRIVGLSKLARVVDAYSRGLQVQERLTNQVADAIEDHLKPSGVGVVLEAVHTCMTVRGARKRSAAFHTSALRGAFRQAETRAEFFALAGRKG